MPPGQHATGAQVTSTDLLLLQMTIAALPPAKRAEILLLKERITTLLCTASSPDIAGYALGWVGLEATEP
jgi:hypothetical protein